MNRCSAVSVDPAVPRHRHVHRICLNGQCPSGRSSGTAAGHAACHMVLLRSSSCRCKVRRSWRTRRAPVALRSLDDRAIGPGNQSTAATLSERLLQSVSIRRLRQVTFPCKDERPSTSFGRKRGHQPNNTVRSTFWAALVTAWINCGNSARVRDSGSTIEMVAIHAPRSSQIGDAMQATAYSDAPI